MADQSLVHREIERRSQDVHRVSNPTDKDYQLVWDGYVDTIPANGTLDLPTSKVDKYLREMSDLILLKKQDQAVIEENKKREKRGEAEMDKWQQQHVLEGKFAIEKGVANPEIRIKLYKELYIGLVKEYGVEKVEKVERNVTPTTHEQAMKEILGSRTPVVDSKPPIISKTPTTPLEKMNQPQLRKVAKEKGIKTSNTDKKEELISKISA